VTRLGVVVVVALSAIAALVDATEAAAQLPPPCDPGSPVPTFSANGKAGPIYTTQDVVFRVRVPGGQDFVVLAFDVSGVRRLPRDQEEGGGLNGVIYATPLAPGALTARATVSLLDANGNECVVSATASFEAREATTPTATLRRPRKLKAKRGRLFSAEWSLVVTAGASGNRSPLTVEARVVKRARLPGAHAKVARRTVSIRESDGADRPRDEPLGSCSVFTIICPRKVRTWPAGVEVLVFDEGGRVVPNGVRVMVELPRGVPRGRRLAPTPAGVDVKVLQNGGAIARLRIAGICRMEGQFSVCRFKTFSTKLG
jgi:hypothetical protein